MSLDDREYMRRPDRDRVSDYTPPVLRRPWWQKLTLPRIDPRSLDGLRPFVKVEGDTEKVD